MRSALICSFILSLVLISACNHGSNRSIFHKHTDWETVGLKGKVKSIISYRCSVGDSFEHCSVFIYKYDQRGLLVEEIDTIGHYFSCDKYFHNDDGLLAKHIYTASAPFPPAVDTYLYSFSEGKRTCITRNQDSSLATADTSVSLYDKNGNEIETFDYRSGSKTNNKYDENGFLISGKVTWKGREPMETFYVNDNKGRILKQTSSNSRGAQAHVYNKDGNEIQQLNYDTLGRKSSDYYFGYCEFDEKGNYLKRISFSPQTKDMTVTHRLIEYY